MLPLKESNLYGLLLAVRVVRGLLVVLLPLLLHSLGPARADIGEEDARVGDGQKDTGNGDPVEKVSDRLTD